MHPHPSLTGNYPPAPEKKCLHPGPQVQSPKNFFQPHLHYIPHFMFSEPSVILWASAYYVAY